VRFEVLTEVKINITELLDDDAVQSGRRVRTFRCNLLLSSPVKMEVVNLRVLLPES
jgi:hypothetical protein